MRLTTRILAIFWVALGVAIWLTMFDLYVSRGAREYGQLRVEAERDNTPAPVMMDVMNRAKRDGLVMSTTLAALVVGGGLATIWAASRAKRTT